jgi:hypothetical protein
MSDTPDNVFDYATPTARRAASLAKIDNPLQAQFIANLLERAGIQCIVLNANSSNLGGVGIVPCELLVRPDDHDRAAEILADLAAGKISLVEPDDPEAAESQSTGAQDDEVNDVPDPRCPKCSSWQVRQYVNFWQDFLRFLHLLPEAPQGSTEFECLRCSHRWVELTDLSPRKK